MSFAIPFFELEPAVEAVFQGFFAGFVFGPFLGKGFSTGLALEAAAQATDGGHGFYGVRFEQAVAAINC